MLTSDAAEWRQALAADERAFGALFDRHHGRVFRHALHLVAVPAEADEVMASSFFELWRRRTEVRLVEESVLPWLLVTATNLSRNRTRGMLRYQRVLAKLPRDEPADAEDEAEARLEQLEQRRRLARALKQVSAVDADLVVLTVLGGLTTAEAAAAVGLAPGAARMRLSRVRGRLRELLADLREPQDQTTGGPRS